MILAVDDYHSAYSQFWGRLGEISIDVERMFQNPGDFELVCFTGGQDVSPHLYGHRNLNSSCSQARDEKELLIFEMAKKHKIPMTGICRGSQFLNVMCGGSMVQHLSVQHGGFQHECRTADARQFGVTSSHHQMSVLGPEGTLLAWADTMVPVDSLVYDGDVTPLLEEMGSLSDDGRLSLVTEAFFYPKERVFAVQHHPEWQKDDQEAPKWTLQKIKELCWGEPSKMLATL